MKTFSAIGIVATALLIATFNAKPASAQGVHIGVGRLHVDVGNPHYRHYSHYGHRGHHGRGYGHGYGGGYGGHHRWHDTSHYDYHPGGYVRHYDHYDYVPGHYDFHPEGHWDHH